MKSSVITGRIHNKDEEQQSKKEESQYEQFRVPAIEQFKQSLSKNL